MANTVFTHILKQRLQSYAENIDENQARFRKCRSITNQIFSIKQTLDGTWEYDFNVYNIVVDFFHKSTAVIQNPPEIFQHSILITKINTGHIHKHNSLCRHTKQTNNIESKVGSCIALFNLKLENRDVKIKHKYVKLYIRLFN